MNYNEAINQLSAKNLKSIYLITGEENYLAEKFLKKLLDIVNPDNDMEALQYFDSTSDIKAILQALDSSPFFSKKNIIIVKDLKLLQEKLSEKDKKDESLFIDYLSNIPDYSILILQNPTKVDKRKKLLKTLGKLGCIVECEAPSSWNISGWLNARLRELNLRFDREAYVYFIEAIKSMDKVSLGFLDQELIKLTLYLQEGQSSNKTLFVNRKILEEMLSSIPEVSAFNMWDALCSKNLTLALKLLDIQQQSKVHPLSLLKFLVRQIRQLWQVKIYLEEGQSSRQISIILELRPFIAKKVINQANNFTLKQIENTLEDLADADYKFKDSSLPISFENIFIRFCS